MGSADPTHPAFPTASPTPSVTPDLIRGQAGLFRPQHMRESSDASADSCAHKRLNPVRPLSPPPQRLSPSPQRKLGSPTSTRLRSPPPPRRNAAKAEWGGRGWVKVRTAACRTMRKHMCIHVDRIATSRRSARPKPAGGKAAESVRTRQQKGCGRSPLVGRVSELHSPRTGRACGVSWICASHKPSPPPACPTPPSSA